MYNDWIDFVSGNKIYTGNNNKLNKVLNEQSSTGSNKWGKQCQQYPISYGDACDPPSSSVVTTYANSIDITFGLYGV